MTDLNPHIQISTKEQSTIESFALNEHQTKQALSLFGTIVQSCYGPKAKLKMIQNATGGHVTITSAAPRLLQAMSISNPVLKLITTAIQSHLSSFSDGGLFVANMAITLINLSLDLDIHRCILISAYECLMKKSVDYLSSDSCMCRIHMDMADLNSLKSIAKCCLATKPACSFVKDDIEYMTNLIVKVFLKSCHIENGTAASFTPVSYVCIEGKPLDNSYLLSGILFEEPSVPTNSKKDLFLHNCMNKLLDREMIRVIVVDISMAGDSKDLIDVKYEVDSNVNIEGATVQDLLLLCNQFHQHKVGLVACQKVVHPAVKKHLKQMGIHVLERLGHQHTKALLQMTGAEAVSSIHMIVTEDNYGWLDNVTHTVIENKSYLRMSCINTSVCTLVLCNRSEESLQELKHVCDAALSNLRICLHTPYCLAGGGCWQIHLAHFLEQQMQSDSAELIADIGCTKLQFQHAVNTFTQSLKLVAMAVDQQCDHMTDTAAHHNWLLPQHSTNSSKFYRLLKKCACGNMTNEDGLLEFSFLSRNSVDLSRVDVDKSSDLCVRDWENVVLDPLSIMKNAVQISVSTSCMVLGISHIVSDKN